jgi:DNA-binding NarL/FixJ family response regulator
MPGSGPPRKGDCEVGISEGTVVVHLRNIMLKLKVNDRTAAVTVAARRGSFT